MRFIFQHSFFEPMRVYYKSVNNRLLTFLGVLAALAVIEVLLQQKAFGQYVIGAYGLFAVFGKIKSEETFRFALVTFAVLLVATAFGGTALAESFAVYAFLLLAIGVICATRELWRDSTLRQKVPLLGLPSKRREVFVSRRKRLKKR